MPTHIFRRRSLPARALVVLSGAALVGGVLAGCSSDGGSGGGSTEAAPTTQASASAAPTAGATTTEAAAPSATETSAAPTQAAASGALTADTFAERVATAGSAKKSVHTELTMKAGGQKISASTDSGFVGDDAVAKGTTEVPGVGDVGFRVPGDGYVYVDLSQMTGGKWVKIDPKDTKDELSQSFGSISTQGDPMASIQQIEGAISSVTPKGTETVDGVETTRYLVVVDTSKLKGDLAAQAKAAGSAMPKTIEYTYWIDGEDLIRKMAFSMAGVEAQLHLTKWGEPFEVKAPAAKDTITSAELQGKA